MKTAREIIAGAASETQRPAQFSQAGWWSVRGKDFEAQADAIIAALAAEGLSIVETGRDPVMEEMPRLTDAMMRAACKAHFGSENIDGVIVTVYERDWSFREAFKRMWNGARYAALSRSTTEGKTG